MTYTVNQYDSPLRWLVSRPEVGTRSTIGYLVEWGEDGSWTCSCRHGETHPGRAQCKHVKMVIQKLLDYVEFENRKTLKPVWNENDSDKVKSLLGEMMLTLKT